MKPSYLTLLFSLFLLPSFNANAAGSALRIACDDDAAGAEVYINGKFKGECPLDMKVPEGTLKLRVQKTVDADHEPRLFEQEIRMGDGVMKKVEVQLSPLELTEEGKRRAFRLAEIRKSFQDKFPDMPLDLALKKVKGNGKRQMAYFTDPGCPFCKRLEKELAEITDVTLYIFLFPILPDSDVIARNVICAKDPIEAWDDWMLNGTAPASAKCTTDKVFKVLGLGAKMRVAGTPTLIFGDGVQSPGYLPAEELEKHLGNSSE